MSKQCIMFIAAFLVLTCCVQLSACGRLLIAAERGGKEAISKAKERDECEPFEVHVALAGDAAVTIAWRTLGSACPKVLYYGTMRSRRLRGTIPDNDGSLPLQSVVGTRFTITEELMCAAPSSLRPVTVRMHQARLDKLEPGEEYWYRARGSTREYTFHAPPARGSSVSFFAMADMGVQGPKCPMVDRTLGAMVKEDKRARTDMVLHAGDMSYANGEPSIWDEFMTAIEPIASRIPYMVAVGNHEYSPYVGPNTNDLSGVSSPYQPWWGNFGDDSGGECGAMTARRFIMPNLRAATDNAPFWYAYSLGVVRFVHISTEHDLEPGSLQYQWLQLELAGVDRCETPWVVVVMHRPMYVVLPHKTNRVVGDHLRDFIEDLLLEYKVDITVSGHVHTYYRTCSVRREQCVIDGSGISHFTIGSGGREMSDALEEQKWLAAGAEEHGFVRFDATSSKLHARFIRTADDTTGDEVTLFPQVSNEGCAARR